MKAGREGAFGVLIVDDEPAARRGIAQLLAADPDFEVLRECGTGADMVEAVRRDCPELVFLDVRMPGLDGFEALARIDPEGAPLVVFVTGYDRYAVRAFEAHAVDYLLKPYSEERFRRSCDRAKEQLWQRRAAENGGYPGRLLALLDDLAARVPVERPSERDPLRFLVRQSQGRVVVVPGTDVLWIEAQRDYVALHTEGGAHLVRDTMASVERRLGDDFVRVHRSTIVRVDGIAEIETGGDRLEVVLRDGSSHPVSSRGRRQLRARLGLKV